MDTVALDEIFPLGYGDRVFCGSNDKFLYLCSSVYNSKKIYKYL